MRGIPVRLVAPFKGSGKVVVGKDCEVVDARTGEHIGLTRKFKVEAEVNDIVKSELELYVEAIDLSIILNVGALVKYREDLRSRVEKVGYIIENLVNRRKEPEGFAYFYERRGN